MIFGDLDNNLTNITTRFKDLKQVLNYDFGGLYKKYDINLTELSTKDINALQEYVNLLNQGKTHSVAFAASMGEATDAAKAQTYGFKNLKIAAEQGAVSENQYTTATQNLILTQRTATATSKALSVALNVLSNIAMSVAITLTIKALTTLADNLTTTNQELDKLRNTTESALDSLKKSSEAFIEESKHIGELTAQYKSIIDSVDNTADAKDELLDIQDDLINTFGDEADGLDLVNGKYDENIEKIRKYTQEKRKEWEKEHADEITRAKQLSEINIIPESHDFTGAVDLFKNTSSNLEGYKSELEDVVKSLFVIKNVNKDLQGYVDNLDGVDYYLKGIFKDDLLLTGSIYDARDALGSLIEAYSKYDNIDAETMTILTERYNLIKKSIASMESLNDATSVNLFKNIFDTATKNLSNLTNTVKVSSDEMRAKWLENLDEMQKGSLKNISTMVSALQDLSEGKGIAANTFWSLIEFDEEGLLNGAKLIGDKFYITQENMIKLKDQYIQKQIESIKLSQKDNEEKYRSYLLEVQTYEQKLRELPLTDKMYNTAAYQRINQQLETARANAKAYGDAIERDRWLIEYLNQTLGNTVDLQKQLEAQQKQLNKELTALNKELDNYQKAYENVIDGIIKSLEAEEDELEKQLDVLEDELDVLEKKKDSLEETLDNYEKINSYVQKIIDKEIESLEEQRDAIKDTYDERINALKTENEERENALEYAQKLANLENAQNNKRRVYDEARGWRYESVKEDVVKAESDLKTFETNQEIKKLEKERDAEIKAWDALIQKKEDYKKQWAAWLEEIQDEEAEALMVEELGADARERITNGDISLLEGFTTKYRAHNNELKILTDTEIKLKKAEIDAKNEDIKASKERIQAWKTYKTEFSTAVTDIKNANAEYMAQIGTIKLTEASNLEDRAIEFEKFKTNVTNYIDQIGAKQTEIDNVTAALEGIQGGTYDIDFNISNLDSLKTVRDYLDQIAADMLTISLYSLNDQQLVQKLITDESFSTADYLQELYRRSGRHLASGGVVNYTGLAMLHGTPQKTETVFNANDSAKLYDMVHNTPNLMADVLNQAQKLSGFKLASNEVSNNSNVSFYIDKIVTDNPIDFERQLDKYYRTKLTQTYTGRN